MRIEQGRHTVPDEKGNEKRLELTIRMMLGVRVAVGRQSNPLDQPGAAISEEEFSHVRPYACFAALLRACRRTVVGGGFHGSGDGLVGVWAGGINCGVCVWRSRGVVVVAIVAGVVYGVAGAGVVVAAAVAVVGVHAWR